MDIYSILQLLGGIILSVGYIPQIRQIIKTKSVEDLNTKTFFNIYLGIALMEVYAINLVLSGSGFMFLITNSLNLILASTMFHLIFYYKRENARKRRLEGEIYRNILQQYQQENCCTCCDEIGCRNECATL